MMTTAGRNPREPRSPTEGPRVTLPRAGRGRRGLPAGLLYLALSASCGGDPEPAADGAATGDSAAGDAVSASAGSEDLRQGADGDDLGAPEGLEASSGEFDDLGGIEADESVEDVAPHPRLVRIPAGTRINVVADEDISTAEYRVGDPVITTVIHDVRGPGGGRLLPQGVRLLGRVKASSGSGGPGERPVLEIAFETLSAYGYERPVEGAVVNAPVVLDPAAARARRSASGRVAAVTEVPGLIMAGTIIGVELRTPVHVPPFAAPTGPEPHGDVDSVPRGDTVAGPDTISRPSEPDRLNLAVRGQPLVTRASGRLAATPGTPPPARRAAGPTTPRATRRASP